MFAPTQTVTLDDGSAIELVSVYSERPLALVFLRHAGCISCREIVSSLKRFPEANVIFVASERAEECAAFRERMASPHRFISDPNRSLYEAFGLGRGGVGQVLHPRVMRRGLEAMKSGVRQGKPSGDPMALGGAFVIDREGVVTWEHRSADISDNPCPQTIVEALARAQEGRVKSYPFAGIAQR